MSHAEADENKFVPKDAFFFPLVQSKMQIERDMSIIAGNSVFKICCLLDIPAVGAIGQSSCSHLSVACVPLAAYLQKLYPFILTELFMAIIVYNVFMFFFFPPVIIQLFFSGTPERPAAGYSYTRLGTTGIEQDYGISLSWPGVPVVENMVPCVLSVLMHLE